MGLPKGLPEGLPKGLPKGPACSPGIAQMPIGTAVCPAQSFSWTLTAAYLDLCDATPCTKSSAVNGGGLRYKGVEEVTIVLVRLLGVLVRGMLGSAMFGIAVQPRGQGEGAGRGAVHCIPFKLRVAPTQGMEELVSQFFATKLATEQFSG